MRIPATDYVEDGWDVEQSARLASVPVEHGVDLVDVSSDGLLPASIAPGYQVPFARSVREGGVKTAAVGMLVGPRQADEILRRGTPTWSWSPGRGCASRTGRCESRTSCA